MSFTKKDKTRMSRIREIKRILNTNLTAQEIDALDQEREERIAVQSGTAVR